MTCKVCKSEELIKVTGGKTMTANRRLSILSNASKASLGPVFLACEVNLPDWKLSLSR